MYRRFGRHTELFPRFRKKMRRVIVRHSLGPGEPPNNQQAAPARTTNVRRSGRAMIVQQRGLGLSICNKGLGTDFIYGKEGMAQAVREKDWSQTSLGPIFTWPDSLRIALGICLNSQFAMVVFWGPELTFIYNDAYVPMLGEKHPWALGQPGAIVWSEVWPAVGTLFHNVMTTGAATRGDDLLLPLERNGFVEECYFTFSHSPIVAETGAVRGVFTAVLETTKKVIDERRIRMLNDMAVKVLLERDEVMVFGGIAEILSSEPYDLPFAVLYLINPEANVATLAFHAGFESKHQPPAASIALDEDDPDSWSHPLWEVVRTSKPQLIELRSAQWEKWRHGTWPRQASQAMVLALRMPGQSNVHGIFVAAANPRRPLDEAYQEFFGLVANYIAMAIARVKIIEAEQRRIASMTQLNRAKSQFFSNTSHELRTPLTLILGPLSEILDLDDNHALSPVVHARLKTIQRNALRLNKLVNSILDFVSIEAGRLPINQKPTDIATHTTEIASLFRSAAESAGLRFSVHCGDAIPSVLIDQEMWEKVVLNLLSNAFKFTQDGAIDITLGCDQVHLYLEVRDTGSGISAEDMPHIFERFFRTKSTAGRSAEGTGIGLSLVQELVRLNGGSVTVDSLPGKGSAFTVQMPLRLAGSRDAGFEKKGVTLQISGDIRQAHSNEARRYASREDGHEDTAASQKSIASNDLVTVLIVDDHEDLIRYIERLLLDQCKVISARDGASGLELARRHRPALILMDVMMRGMDGLETLRAIRADETLRAISVIMLSACADEEARIAALTAGADDYLVKPFNVRELIARIYSNIQLMRIRWDAITRENELLRQIADVRQDLERVVEWTSDGFANFDRDLRITNLNDAAAYLISQPKQALIGRRLSEVVQGRKGSRLESALRRAIGEQVIVSIEHMHVGSGRWITIRCYPTAHGVFAFGADVTEQKRGRDALRVAHSRLESRVEKRTQELYEANALLAAVFDRAPGGIAITDIDGNFIRANAAYQKLTGYTEEELLAQSLEKLTVAAEYPKKKALLRQLLNGERDCFEMEMPYRRADDTIIWLSNFVSAINDEQQQPQYFVKITQDITDRKNAELKLLDSQMELRTLYERLQSAREEERLALAREVHDQLGQILSAAKIDIKLLKEDIHAPRAQLSRGKILRELQSALSSIENAIHVVREIATELRPPELDGQGLHAAIEWQARDFERRTRIRCEVVASTGWREPTRVVALALFRIFQESMTNILRHAKATQVWITLGCRCSVALLRVRDNGVGIPRACVRSVGSIGLKGMRERAAIIRGSLIIGAARPQGTLVAVRAPLASDEYANSYELDRKSDHAQEMDYDKNSHLG
ncbi:ATP-binding protein [Noviherbaspirillum sp. Root189]|uniref:ATP-binding protein n=1 Tax=Noviherbaspirillum sp. Root189 TaxID=1736487 RepID=UPI00070BF9F9|nr:ATP-binding protein [Noviherbaspirillum sp. Root189]KRB75763.1 hypothetical protein ASE07_26510 [Noviherbaspirillum sp. Root189]